MAVFALARKPKEITLLDVIEAVEGVNLFAAVFV